MVGAISKLWPHQEQALADIARLRAAGATSICVTSPTGGGKTRIMVQLIHEARARQERVVLYTNRRLLIEQLASVLTENGIDHGMRTSDHEPRLLEEVQVSSIYTELSRVFRQQKWDLHDASLVLVDEAHNHKQRTACRIIEQHRQAGATIIGFTATPVALGHIYQHLVVAGTTSTLRDCGALVPVVHYGPDEPDLRHIRVQASGEFAAKDLKRIVKVQHLFGRVRDSFEQLNPEWGPTLLFAPGVAESLWFAKKFCAAGIPAAHIDGADVWCDGEMSPTSPERRAEVIRKHADQEIIILCNRFVLREGIDLPWVTHGILATPFGSIVSYLQAGGRLLRAWPGKQRVIVQDHGGNWWRHGSLNWDRQWDMHLGAKSMTEVLHDDFRRRARPEPVHCPQCDRILCGPVCPCGYVIGPRRERMVMMHDGRLVRYHGRIFTRRVTEVRPDTATLWQRIYWRARKSRNGMTFRQALGLFFKENRYRPPMNLPWMPLRAMDWYRRVRDVPRDALVPDPRKRPAR